MRRVPGRAVRLPRYRVLRGIYEAAEENEERIAHLVKDREEAAFDQWVEYLVEQRERDRVVAQMRLFS